MARVDHTLTFTVISIYALMIVCKNKSPLPKHSTRWPMNYWPAMILGIDIQPITILRDTKIPVDVF